MTQPIPLDTILSEFNENSEAWVLQDKKSKNTLRCLIIVTRASVLSVFFCEKKMQRNFYKKFWMIMSI